MVLAKKLPPSHRVILVERNTHFNHLYVFPRFTVYPGHEHKAFVPYSSIFSESPVRKVDPAKDPSGANVPMDAAGIEKAILEEQYENAEERETARKVVELSNQVKDSLIVDQKEGERAPLSQVSEPTHDAYENAEPHLVVCGEVLGITKTHVSVRRHGHDGDEAAKPKLWSIDTINIPYTHLIYALGSHMPDPLRHNTYLKAKGVEWMKNAQARIKQSQEIILVGGGALGVELATDIKTLYPHKDVTLIHSRQQLLPNFDIRVHEAAMAQLNELGVKVLLGHRLALAEGCPMGSSVEHFNKATPPLDKGPDGKPIPKIIELDPPEGHESEPVRHRIRTTLGLELECDLLLLCTGQQPNSSLMAQFSPLSVSHKTRLVSVLPTLQVMISHETDAVNRPFDAVPPCKDCDCFLDHKAAGGEHDHLTPDVEGAPKPACYPNIYAIGDVADAFGALNAGYQAWFMGETAAENVLRDITHRADSEDPASVVPEDEPVPLQHFTPRPDMIKLTIGKGRVVTQGAPEPDPTLPGTPTRPTVTLTDDTEDMYIESVWKNMALADPSDMYV